MPEVLACGELLIDFMPTVSGLPLIDTPGFLRAPGGAPANVAVGLARLGVTAGFLGKVGDDPFGRFLARTLQEEGVDISQLRFDPTARTALAFVSLTAAGERDFMFYRHPSADMLWRPEEIDVACFQGVRIFHFGSISLISEPSRSATLHAIALARAAGALISYDPNLRLPLWPSADAARAGMRLGWQHADIVKASEVEVAFLTDEDDLERGVDRLWAAGPARLLVVTLGAEGCLWRAAAGGGQSPGFAVPTVDTTGAGDGFVAGLLAGLLARGLTIEENALPDLCRFANAVGALTTTVKGAIPALPTRQAVEAFLRERSQSRSEKM